MLLCGDSARKLPNAGKRQCCMGAAVYGPQRCTCWETTFDAEQQPAAPAPPAIRSTACGDCAYRPGSPERSGETGYAGDEDLLDELTISGHPFYCHQGIRKAVSERHPSGKEIPSHPADYVPLILDNVPYRADGTPADLCAGWAARSKQP